MASFKNFGRRRWSFGELRSALRFDESGQQLVNHFARDIGEAEVTALMPIGELFVIESEAVEEGGMQVVYVNLIFNDVHAQIVRSACGRAWLDASSREPHRECIGVMVTSEGALFSRHEGLSERRASELTAPNNKGIFQQSSLLEVLD